MGKPILDALKQAEARGTSIKPKGIDLVRAGIANALHSGSHREAVQYAANRWGEKSRAAENDKAAVPGSTTTATTQGLALVNNSAAVEFFDVVLSQAVNRRLPFAEFLFAPPR